MELLESSMHAVVAIADKEESVYIDEAAKNLTLALAQRVAKDNDCEILTTKSKL
jgi:hypothetical protein